MREKQVYNIISFIKEETAYFRKKAKEVSYDDFLANKDLKKILNSTLNELILATIDLAGECLRKAGMKVPVTYKEIILSTRELLGDVALKTASLAKLRNETIHEYMKVNWKNIQFMRASGIDIIDAFLKSAERFLKK